MALSCAGDFFYLLLYIQTTKKKMTLIFHSKVNVAPEESRELTPCDPFPPMPLNVPCYPNNSPSSKVWYFSKISLTDKNLKSKYLPMWSNDTKCQNSGLTKIMTRNVVKNPLSKNCQIKKVTKMNREMFLVEIPHFVQAIAEKK